MKQIKFQSEAVADIFKSYPKDIREKLLFLRQLIFDTAAKTTGVGKLEETVKWGEPSYLTGETKSGSTIRLGWKKVQNQYGIFFNCKTTLVDTFKNIYGDKFKYEKNRAILFDLEDHIPVKWLRHCIALALTYHVDKKELK
jgi:hypothetical protein